MNNIRSTYHCEVEVLTPLHIGNGDKYIENFDFSHDPTSKKILVFDRNKLLRQVAGAGHSTIETFTSEIEQDNLSAWLKSSPEGIDLDSATIHSFSHDKKPRDILVQLRTGMGDAILAGSSLKGAFRTAVLARLSMDEQRQSVEPLKNRILSTRHLNLKFADNDISSHLLGRDAQTNLMRCLTVVDCAFPPDSIKLQSVLLFRLTDNRDMAVKFGVMVEKISEGSRGVCQVSFDTFLRQNGQTSMGFRISMTLDWLLEAVRQKTNKTISTELNFLQKIRNPNAQAVKSFYEQLRNQVGELNQNEVMLQLAWGSGWNGMTGEMLEKEDLSDNIRKKLQLAQNYLKFTFPKSRRFAITNGQAVPMGWVKLSFISKDEMKAREAQKWQEKQDEKKKKDDRKKKGAFKKALWDDMDDIEQAVAVIQRTDLALSQAPHKDGLRDIWPILENTDLENGKKLAHAFIQAWQNEPASWRKKHCSTGQWKKVETAIKITGIAHPDIQQLDPADKELIDQVDSFADFGQFANASLEMRELTLPAAKTLEASLIKWGCNNKRAGKNKKRAWDKLQHQLKRLRKA